jgi:hypothetical protein
MWIWRRACIESKTAENKYHRVEDGNLAIYAPAKLSFYGLHGLTLRSIADLLTRITAHEYSPTGEPAMQLV